MEHVPRACFAEKGVGQPRDHSLCTSSRLRAQAERWPLFRGLGGGTLVKGEGASCGISRYSSAATPYTAHKQKEIRTNIFLVLFGLF